MAMRRGARSGGGAAIHNASPIASHEMVGISREELQAKTGAPLTFAPDCKPLTAPAIAGRP